MPRLRAAVASVLCAHVLVAAQAATVLIDSQAGSYLQPGRSSQASTGLLGGVVAALTGLHPGGDIDSPTSRDIATVVKPNPLKKPSALVSLSVAGLGPEDVALPSRNTHTLDGHEHDGHVLAGLMAQNPDLALYQLEELAAQACQGGSQDCLDQLLSKTARALGGQYDGRQLTLGEAHLDMQQPQDRLFAAELASVTTGLQELLKQVHAGNTPQDIMMTDATVLGLQGLGSAHGADSPQVAGSKAAVQRLLAWMASQLDAAFDGDAVMQVTVLESMPGIVSPDSAVTWKQHRRRRLQQVAAAPSSNPFPGNETEQTAAARRFSSKAAAYGGFILMLYFLLGGVYCLCNMPFKRDSLLYGSKKTD